MQIENHNEIENVEHAALSEHEQVSLYRTKWLMAHNRLHVIVHEPSASLAENWSAYLSELQSAEKMAQQPA